MSDLISRQAAIDEYFYVEYNGRIVMVVDVYTLENLPSVQPKRKKGHWVYNSYGNGCGNYHCSACGKIEIGKTVIMWRYCPNCGAGMRGEQGETD